MAKLIINFRMISLQTAHFQRVIYRLYIDTLKN